MCGGEHRILPPSILLLRHIIGPSPLTLSILHEFCRFTKGVLYQACKYLLYDILINTARLVKAISGTWINLGTSLYQPSKITNVPYPGYKRGNPNRLTTGNPTQHLATIATPTVTTIRPSHQIHSYHAHHDQGDNRYGTRRHQQGSTVTQH